MEEKIISEEQLETMRHKARKRQNIAIVLTFLAFVLYVGMFLCCID
ncbi:unknown [Clostridium sp. CAG:505]|nr:unknown [Clostridium sp. CAG:505]